jgi:outer membrane protein assembly factor BamB
MSRYDPAGTAFSPTATGPKDDVSVAWAAAAPDWFAGTSAPTLHQGTVYAAGGGMLALDIGTGARRFGFPGPYRSTPAVARTEVYETPTLATAAPTGLFGVNASGGIEIPLVRRPLGGERWERAEATSSGFFGPSEPVAPVTAAERVFAPATGTDAVVAVDATDGEVQWRRRVTDADDHGVEFRRPAVRDGALFVTNWPFRATAFDVQTGERRWQRDLDDQLVLPPVATTEGLVVPSRTSVWLLDSDDGTTLWKRDLDGNATESTPAVADGTVFLTDEVGSLYALDLATGETDWTVPFDGATAPVVADGVVYAVREGIELLAFDAETGTRRFQFAPPQVPLSPPAVGDGALYLANRYRVVALEEAR